MFLSSGDGVVIGGSSLAQAREESLIEAGAEPLTGLKGA